MNLVNLALNRHSGLTNGMSWPWSGYVASPVAVVVLVGLPFGAVIYAIVRARGP
jgi:hypothetical protein